MNGAPSAMVSPGLWGFVAFFVLALALYLLMRNMNARMRRMSYRAEELQREADAETKSRAAGTDVPKTDSRQDERDEQQGTTPQEGDPAP